MNFGVTRSGGTYFLPQPKDALHASSKPRFFSLSRSVWKSSRPRATRRKVVKTVADSELFRAAWVGSAALGSVDRWLARFRSRADVQGANLQASHSLDHDRRAETAQDQR